MKKVVDANFLRHPALEVYLRQDPNNQVVLTDYACIECYKGNSARNMRYSLGIVSKYPEQVMVLRGTREIVRLQAESRPTPADLVDPIQSGEFREFCRAVQAAVEGNAALMGRLLRIGEIANAQLAGMQGKSPDLAKAILQIARTFEPRHLAELRARGPVSSGTVDVIARNTMLLAASFFRSHPDVSTSPAADRVRDTFVFRFALSAQLLVVRWLVEGGVEGVGDDKLRNDVVDATYVAYATLFDGILSRDRKLLDIYEEALIFLQESFPSDIGPESSPDTP